MAPFQFLGGFYQLDSHEASVQSTKNWYGELIEAQGERNVARLVPMPGTDYFHGYFSGDTDLLGNFVNVEGGPNAMRGALRVVGSFGASSAIFGDGSDTFFAVSRDRVWLFYYNAVLGRIQTVANLFTLAGGNGLDPVQIIQGGEYVLFLNNGLLTAYNLTTGVATQIPSSTFSNLISNIGYLDNFFFATLKTSRTFHVSAVANATSWPGAQTITISLIHDNIVGMKAINRELWFLGQTKSVAYYVSGSANVVDPIQSSVVEHGCEARLSVEAFDGALTYLEQDKDGVAIVRQMRGYTPQRVSTHAIEREFASYSRRDDAVAYTFQMNGHSFYRLFFPTVKKMWQLDGATGLWSEPTYWRTDIGQHEAHHSWWHVYCFGKHWVGDWAIARIYELTEANSFDVDCRPSRIAGLQTNPITSTALGLFYTPIRRERRTPHIGKRGARTFGKRLELLMDTGVGEMQRTNHGPISPTGASDDASIGTVAWTNPTNAVASDDALTNVVLGPGATSHRLLLTGFTFPSVPTDAVRICVLLELESSGSVSPPTIITQLRRSGTLIGNQKSNSPGSQNTYTPYGNLSDDWGASITAADINSNLIDAAVHVVGSAFVATTAIIDHGRLTIKYERPRPMLIDANGEPREAEIYMRVSDDGGKNWADEQVRKLGAPGKHQSRVYWNKLGSWEQSRVFEIASSDPVPLRILDADLDAE